MVGQRPLKPLIMVRIHVPEQIHKVCVSYWWFATGSRDELGTSEPLPRIYYGANPCPRAPNNLTKKPLNLS